MAIINLRDFYPFYNSDMMIEVPDDIALALLESERAEATYRRRMFRHKAHFSLDRGDGIEHEALFVVQTPCEVYERKLIMQQLRAALASLSEVQRRRVYAHYILGLSKARIAKAENVRESSVRESIERGLKNMEQFFKNI